eukprot:TRINITY_DN7237_c0_g1_i1.p1 TRINITY_DN7237_c0_g1~~TRINITY_DN7237_c0_g1_i1.p1  ORF type:complete len:407 (+),score=90.10 TRINITY_DN7237_c0_g1_i1:135-1355(+)
MSELPLPHADSAHWGVVWETLGPIAAGVRTLSSFHQLVGVVASTRHPRSQFSAQDEALLLSISSFAQDYVHETMPASRFFTVTVPSMAAYCLALSTEFKHPALQCISDETEVSLSHWQCSSLLANLFFGTFEQTGWLLPSTTYPLPGRPVDWKTAFCRVLSYFHQIALSGVPPSSVVYSTSREGSTQNSSVEQWVAGLLFAQGTRAPSVSGALEPAVIPALSCTITAALQSSEQVDSEDWSMLFVAEELEVLEAHLAGLQSSARSLLRMPSEDEAHWALVVEKLGPIASKHKRLEYVEELVGVVGSTRHPLVHENGDGFLAMSQVFEHAQTDQEVTRLLHHALPEMAHHALLLQTVLPEGLSMLVGPGQCTLTRGQVCALAANVFFCTLPDAVSYTHLTLPTKRIV